MTFWEMFALVIVMRWITSSAKAEGLANGIKESKLERRIQELENRYLEDRYLID